VLGAGAAPGDWPEKLSAYLHLLVRWNEQINLVSRKSIDRVVEAQVVPSLAALQLLPADQPIKLLDVGSGGGFPGIPCAILRPCAEIALVEATRKKSLFLEAVVRELGLERTTVHWTRVEAPTPALRALAPFDVGSSAFWNATALT
jgi:16S rRNA (guanine527-N7)-methyltransferase